MSALTSAHPAHHVFGEGFFRHAGQIAHSLWESLQAAKRRRAAARAADELEQLCRHYESTMPDLANELRFIASRG
ncbi:MAG TPA: hypothetical protein VJ652_10380 [Noviherbaspirillum sp.]|nr:hypothetical protein [Noviherbaspirillum sp.]